MPGPSKGIIHDAHLPPNLSTLSLSLTASPWSTSISPPPRMRDRPSERRTAFAGGGAGAEEGTPARYSSHMVVSLASSPPPTPGPPNLSPGSWCVPFCCCCGGTSIGLANACTCACWGAPHCWLCHSRLKVPAVAADDADAAMRLPNGLWGTLKMACGPRAWCANGCTWYRGGMGVAVMGYGLGPRAVLVRWKVFGFLWGYGYSAEGAVLSPGLVKPAKRAQ